MCMHLHQKMHHSGRILRVLTCFRRLQISMAKAVIVRIVVGLKELRAPSAWRLALPALGILEPVSQFFLCEVANVCMCVRNMGRYW